MEVEPAKKPSPKKAPAPAAKKAPGAGKKQTTLAGFFTKKKPPAWFDFFCWF